MIFITIPILSFGYILFLGIKNILKKEGDVMSKAEFNMLKQFRGKTVNVLDLLINDTPILIPQTKEDETRFKVGLDMLNDLKAELSDETKSMAELNEIIDIDAVLQDYDEIMTILNYSENDNKLLIDKIMHRISYQKDMRRNNDEQEN